MTTIQSYKIRSRLFELRVSLILLNKEILHESLHLLDLLLAHVLDLDALLLYQLYDQLARLPLPLLQLGFHCLAFPGCYHWVDVELVLILELDFSAETVVATASTESHYNLLIIYN